MGERIFINLPVRDLEKAKAFYTALGYALNPKFTDGNAACVVVSEHICLMLLVHDLFKGFTDKAICDTATHIEALFALSTGSREQADALMEKALAAGARETRDADDYGFMYQRAFADPDGHTFEIFYMNEAEFPGAGQEN